MNLEEAKALLSTAAKSELQDHAFGDAEVVWYKDEAEDGYHQVASGYFGGGSASVSVRDEEGIWFSFKDEDARCLRAVFASMQTERNDETGPHTFVEDQVMPGLTLEGVRKELTDE